MRKDGALLDISLTISPVKDGAGHIVGASKVARDITERKQAEERERRMTAEAVTATAKFRACSNKRRYSLESSTLTG